MTECTLYGIPNSLYTGRARSYLIKAGIAYRELAPNRPHFAEHVVAKAGGKWSLPTIEFANGEVIRDGVAIVDYFETESDGPFAPTSPRQRVASLLFDVIGAEGLLRPAMHYRWNFPDENLALLRFHFRTIVPDVPNRDEIAEGGMDRMRAACMAFGAVPDTLAVVEALYAGVVEKLDAHFARYPYLLGGRPCIGDFGLIAPMYGHLGRDPKPLSILQSEAMHVLRWVERMNRPDADAGEFPDPAPGYLPDDEVPDTLVDVLREIATDFVPETRAACAAINEWIAAQAALPPGTPCERGVGQAKFEVRDVTVSAMAQPFRFYLLKRVQDAVAAMGEADRRAATELLAACGMSDILELKLSRDIGRDGNLEVWR